MHDSALNSGQNKDYLEFLTTAATCLSSLQLNSIAGYLSFAGFDWSRPGRKKDLKIFAVNMKVRERGKED